MIVCTAFVFREHRQNRIFHIFRTYLIGSHGTASGSPGELFFLTNLPYAKKGFGPL